MRRGLLVGAVLVAALAGCTGTHTAAPAPSSNNKTAPPSTTAPAPTPSPSLPQEPQETARLVYSNQGAGPLVFSPNVSGPVISVRFTCIGPSKTTSIKSVGGGTIMRTGGCEAGVIYGASFTRSARLDPSKITLTVDSGTVWEIQVWQGKYIQRAGVPADTASPAASA